MLLISYTAARENLAKTMEQVCTDHQPVMNTVKHGSLDVLNPSWRLVAPDSIPKT